MEYIIAVVLLFGGMLLYFRIADKYNIIDKPNFRSAHSEITIRGGGVIFVIAFLLFLISFWWNDKSFFFPQNFLIFGAGFLIVTTVSFVDDIIDSSTKVRLFYQFLAVSILLYFIHSFQIISWHWFPIIYIMIIGTMNAYNFMDGINGMTGLYSLGTLFTFLYLQMEKNDFTDSDFIIFPILACVVFLFFNMRKKAKCFMGDVGSMGIAYWIIALIGLLMIKTGEIKWILLLAVYGVEVVLTILERLKLKENIFEAHRRHLYQLLVHEKKIPHVMVSFFYAAVQILINFILISYPNSDWTIFCVILIPLSVIYLISKMAIKKQMSLKTN